MILHENPKNVVVNGNFKTSSFGIAVSGKMFDMFSNRIYTHKVRAVIRETSCNALDAHVDAGVTKPFLVHLPTMFEPWFSVRDYGKGLDDEDVRTIYCIYGASTKEHRNDQIGALGLGSKSPFSIVDSFMVTSNFQGKKRTYSCYLNEKSEPQIAQLTEEDTDETGIEVYVPVEGKADEFKEEAVFVYQYFSAQPTINIEGIEKEISEAQSRYVMNTTDFSVTRDSGTMKAVMGNVAYEIPRFGESDPETGQWVNYQINLDGFYKFELGELDFDPGREVLSMNEMTKANVKAKVIKLQESVRQILIDQIEAEPTPYKQFLMKEIVVSGALAGYCGSRKFFDKYDLPECDEKEPYVVYKTNGYSKSSVERETRTQFFVGQNAEIFFHAPRMEARIRHYLKNKGQRASVILLTPVQAALMKIDADVIRNDIETYITKLPKNIVGGHAMVVNVKTFTWNGNTGWKSSGNWDNVTVNIADATQEHVYVEVNRWEIKRQAINGIRDCDDIKRIKNQVEGFIDWPEIYGLKTAILDQVGFKKGNWIKLSDYIKRELEANKPKLVYVYSGGEEDLFASLAKELKIPEAVKLTELIKKINKEKPFADFCETAGLTLDKDKSADIMDADFFKKYPMLKFVGASQVKKHSSELKEYMVCQQQITQIQKSKSKPAKHRKGYQTSWK